MTVWTPINVALAILIPVSIQSFLLAIAPSHASTFLLLFPAPGMMRSLIHVAGVPACAVDEHIIPLAKLSTSTLTHVLGVQEVSGLRSEERVYGAHAAVAAANARKRAAAESSGSAAPVGGGGDAPKRWAPRVSHYIPRYGFACGDLVLLANAQRRARPAESFKPAVDIRDLCSISYSSDARAVVLRLVQLGAGLSAW